MVFVDEAGLPTRAVYQAQWTYYVARYGAFYMPSTGSLYRASLLKENPLDIDFHMIMDTEWMLRNGEKMRTRRLRAKAVAFRVTEDNKTSANIQTGEVTPRHAAERKVLAGRYRFYGPPKEDLGAIGKFILGLRRKGIRVSILADKAISRFLDRS